MQNLLLLNRQMVLMGQLKTMAQLHAPAQDFRTLFRKLQAQTALLRLGYGQAPLQGLAPECEALIERLEREGQLKLSFFQQCSSFSNQALKLLERELKQVQGPSPELSKLVQETRSDVKELMDWVVLLAGGKPNS